MNARHTRQIPSPSFVLRHTATAAQLLVAGCLAAAATAAHAQAQAPAQPASPSVNLPTVTVTSEQDKGYAARRSTSATKTDTALIDTPQSISVVTQDQVRDQGSQGLAEALRYVPGVGFAQGEGNRETPIFRGISTTGDFYVDGMRDDVQYYRDLYNIERVEVLRGPNAMIFGRGATGGLINRVTKMPNWTAGYGGSLTLGSNSNRRVTADINQSLNDQVSIRLNALYEKSDSYRDGVWLERKGINPTISWKLAPKTLASLSYEHFEDDRIADRGISSFQGRPLQTSPSTFFGNAAASPTWTRLDAATLTLEHEFDSGVAVRNRTRWSDQDKFYQNVFPGATNATGTQVAISAYNNMTRRKSVFNQTDVTFNLDAGGLRHRFLAGAEFGVQDTDNHRETGYFPGGATSVNVPVANPFTSLPVSFRPSATDADNSGKAKVAAFYLQDQVEITRNLQVVAGVRYDRFKVDFTNNRNGQVLNPSDDLVSPRVGVIYKPVQDLALYANYSVAYQPRAGDQLSSLTATNAAFKPEKFKNYEIGAKWDIKRNLSATAALFRLDRSNVVVLDPSDPTNTRTMLSDGQRTEGLELSVSGNLTPSWSVAGGYAYTDAKFVADTSATLRTGGAVGQVPKHTFALWNRYEITQSWAAALGVIRRTKMFAANEQIATGGVSPNVVLPGYTRFDAAVFYKIDAKTSLQLNVENLFDKKYYINANSNTNITPGSPRALRVSLNKSF
ncbi:TonB-dependent siderophore receptor [Delftia sp. SD018]|uniref:TonB-dependent receptor n=1 Tax=unclassified Delftia TaxID=2613839 RepID=UPI001A9735AB|nr:MULTISPECIES: TonB-dependent siderophore receptor [unclassified Delftia]MBO0991205.1 TonB-dependent siderophore receptor [Delftia sp. SD083]MBO1037621.1 TonB-dependent siderophore receptor [Delftia sp. SD018]